MTQQLIVLAQELDRFVSLADESVAFSQRCGMMSAFSENDSSQCCRIVGKFQEDRVVHDSAA